MPNVLGYPLFSVVNRAVPKSQCFPFQKAMVTRPFFCLGNAVTFATERTSRQSNTPSVREFLFLYDSEIQVILDQKVFPQSEDL